jgi:hypothetical protein
MYVYTYIRMCIGIRHRGALYVCIYVCIYVYMCIGIRHRGVHSDQAVDKSDYSRHFVDPFDI